MLTNNQLGLVAFYWGHLTASAHATILYMYNEPCFENYGQISQGPIYVFHLPLCMWE